MFFCLVLQIEGKHAQWKHFEMFYDIDSQNSIRMAPKITKKHVSLPPFTNMRVRLATQVFSHTVAAGRQLLFKKNVFVLCI